MAVGGESMFDVAMDSCGCDCELGAVGSAGADDERSSTELWRSAFSFGALDLRRLALCGRSLGIANRLVCILLRGLVCSEEN